jgi:hypothetical protein
MISGPPASSLNKVLQNCRDAGVPAKTGKKKHDIACENNALVLAWFFLFM